MQASGRSLSLLLLEPALLRPDPRWRTGCRLLNVASKFAAHLILRGFVSAPGLSQRAPSRGRMIGYKLYDGERFGLVMAESAEGCSYVVRSNSFAEYTEQDRCQHANLLWSRIIEALLSIHDGRSGAFHRWHADVRHHERLDPPTKYSTTAIQIYQYTFRSRCR